MSENLEDLEQWGELSCHLQGHPGFGIEFFGPLFDFIVIFVGFLGHDYMIIGWSVQI